MVFYFGEIFPYQLPIQTCVYGKHGVVCGKLKPQDNLSDRRRIELWQICRSFQDALSGQTTLSQGVNMPMSALILVVAKISVNSFSNRTVMRFRYYYDRYTRKVRLLECRKTGAGTTDGGSLVSHRSKVRFQQVAAGLAIVFLGGWVAIADPGSGRKVRGTWTNVAVSG